MECKNQHKGCCAVDMGRGATFCNCGENPEAAMCEGCFKLHTTDWLDEYPDNFADDIFEVRFKNTRRSYYKNVNGLALERGDIVAVEASPGHDIGIVSLTGDLVARQMKRVGFNPMNGEFKKIYRKAKPYDIEKWQEAIALEHETMIRSREIASDMGLNMKIGDVEYQGDRIKAIFYYIADERVDFRELIKVFAEQFRIRVEMKQIGARQEAGRIGGLGSCGRELCCASWIASFQSVTTGAARQQEISLNPQKLAGQCGKLKCCLTYELDTYLDARRELPRVNQPLQALDGEYFLVKTDILARTMSFSTSPHAMVGVITIPSGRVSEILEINRRGEKADKIAVEPQNRPVSEQEHTFVNMIGEESITRFDKQKGDKRGRNRGKKSRGGQSTGQSAGQQGVSPQGGGQGGSSHGSRPRPRTGEGSNVRHENRQNPQSGNKPGGVSGGRNVHGQPRNASENPRGDGGQRIVKPNENPREGGQPRNANENPRGGGQQRNIRRPSGGGRSGNPSGNPSGKPPGTNNGGTPVSGA